MAEWRPRSPRYDIARTDGISVHLVQIEDQKEVASIPASLRQISLGGARMITQRPLVLEETLSMKVELGDGDFEAIVDARVAWARPLQGNDWLIGCAFSPELPERVLDEMAHQKMINRRGHGRMLATTPAQIRRQACSDMIPVTIADVSHGGICLELDCLEELETHLQIVVESDGKQHSAHVLVRWRMETEGTAPNLMGCEFTDEREATMIRQILEDLRFAEMNS